MRQKRTLDYVTLPGIVVKGHKITLRLIPSSGIFKAELEDGTEFESTTLEGLKTVFKTTLEQVSKKPKTEISCLKVDRWNKSEVRAAKFVGYHKTNRWNPLMFIVDGKKENEGDAEDYLLANTDLKMLRDLVSAKLLAEEALDTFLKKNQFKPPNNPNKTSKGND